MDRVKVKRAIGQRDCLRGDGWRCHYCLHLVVKEDGPSPYLGVTERAQVEHVVPKSRGGTDALENLVLSCARCNQRKGTKTGEEFFSQLEIERLAAFA